MGTVVQRSLEWGEPQTRLWNLFMTLSPSCLVSWDLSSWSGELLVARWGRSVCLTAHRLDCRAYCRDGPHGPWGAHLGRDQAGGQVCEWVWLLHPQRWGVPQPDGCILLARPSPRWDEWAQAAQGRRGCLQRFCYDRKELVWLLFYFNTLKNCGMYHHTCEKCI